MSKMKRRCAVISTIIIVSLLAGCSAGGIFDSYSAIEDLQLVRTMAVDAAGPGRAAVTVSSGRGGEAGEPLVLGREGEGLLAAIESLRDFTPRGDLFFAHTQSIVLGEAYAAQGIGDLLDFAERDVQLRLGTDLFVLRGAEAGEFVAGTEFDAGDVLDSVRRVLRERADSSVGNLRQTAVELSEYGAALVCALAPAEAEGSIFPDDGALTAVPAGYAVLRGGALAGYLSGGEAEAASLLTGRAVRFRRTVDAPGGGRVELLCEPEGLHLSVRWAEDGTPPLLTISVALSAVVAELDGAEGNITDPEALARFGAEAAERVQADIAALLARSQAMDADFLALGRTLRLDSGTRFAALGSGWLPALRWSVEVSCAVTHSYDMNNPVGTEGGGV